MRIKQCNNGISKYHKSFKKYSKQNNSVTVTNENDRRIPKERTRERHIFPEKKQNKY